MNTWILLLIFAAIAYIIYQRNNGHSWKKIFGLGLIFLGILFFEPSPDPITLGAYAIIHGLTFSSINTSNISTYLWDFEIWSCTIGIILLLAGMFIMGWDFKKIWKKINLGRYNIALIIAFGTVLAVALWDIWSMNSGIFGSVIEYTAGNYSEGWWNLFYKFVLTFFLIVPICYFYFVKKDFSESFGILIFEIILFFGGLADIGYFIFQGLNIPPELPWLMGSPFISFISTSLGYSTVTNVSLLFSVFVSLILSWLVAKTLKEKF